jgi:hypothetical protein
LVGVRLLALSLMVIGLWKGIAVTVEFANELDRTYWQLFFQARLADPLCALVLGLGLMGVSRRVARWVAGG